MAAARTRCRRCGEPFTEANVYSAAGWLETGISGLCETCFDTLADYGLSEPTAGLQIGGSDNEAGIREQENEKTEGDTG